MKTIRKTTAALVVAAVLAPASGLVPAAALYVTPDPSLSADPGAMRNHPLTGVWIATVDPRPDPTGDQPPFESTLAYGRAHLVHEITSRTASASAGLGAWEKVAESTYVIRFAKYRFDPTGAYLGKTVVTEEITVLGAQRYRGSARTQVVDTSGAVVAEFESDVSAQRLTP